jgi:hypothetical protein
MKAKEKSNARLNIFPQRFIRLDRIISEKGNQQLLLKGKQNYQ